MASFSSISSLTDHVASLRETISDSDEYRRVMANQDLESFLPVYSGIEEGIHQIASRIFNGVSLSVVSAPSFKGLSGSVFYQVIDSTTRKICCLAKVFPEDRSYEFLDEVYSLKTYGEHSIRCPKVLAVGLLKTEEQKRGVLMEEMIPGNTLKYHVAQLSDLKNSEELKRLFNSFGKFIAKFHQQGSTTIGPTDSYVKDHFLGIIENALKELEGADEQICQYYGIKNKTSFIQFLRKYMQHGNDLMKHSAPRSFIHMDCNFSNFIYGEDGEFHLLDTYWGAFAVDGKKAPRGVPFLDYMQVINRLGYLYNDGKLSSHEYEELKTQFQRGYKTIGVIPESEAQNFYSFIDAMLLLGGVTKWFHHGAKELLGNCAQYWVAWLEELRRLDEEKVVSSTVA